MKSDRGYRSVQEEEEPDRCKDDFEEEVVKVVVFSAESMCVCVYLYIYSRPTSPSMLVHIDI